MHIKYKGKKETLKLTRPELQDKYTFTGNKPVEVSTKDGLYLCEEFPRSFEKVDEPAKPPKAQPKKDPEPKTTPAKESEPEKAPDKNEVKVDGAIAIFIEKHFPGQTIDQVSKEEIQAKCLKMTEQKVKINKSKSVENMLTDFMAAVADPKE